MISSRLYRLLGNKDYNAHLNLQCKSDKGAALIVKGPTSSFRAFNPNKLEDEFIVQQERWLAWIGKNYAEKIELRDLVVVTGVDLVTAWAIASFLDRDVNCEFKVSIDDRRSSSPSRVWIDYSKNTSVPIRRGPAYRDTAKLHSSLNSASLIGKKKGNSRNIEEELIKTTVLEESSDSENHRTEPTDGWGSREEGRRRAEKGKEKELVGDPLSKDVNQCVFLHVWRLRKRSQAFSFIPPALSSLARFMRKELPKIPDMLERSDQPTQHGVMGIGEDENDTEGDRDEEDRAGGDDDNQAFPATSAYLTRSATSGDLSPDAVSSIPPRFSERYSYDLQPAEGSIHDQIFRFLFRVGIHSLQCYMLKML